ncbi:MAG TPA: hypothetical protein VNI20_05755 [Fimbriimonadaceae bacterium]|nr:hypothetical protein [Fimbriimonadaceae bacterium]
MTWRTDAALYALIAMLAAAQTFVGSGDLPAWLAPWIGIVLAGLTAVKAKRSRGVSDKKEIQE